MAANRTLRVAVAQCCSAAFDLTKTLEKLERLTLQARDENAKLCVFPEAFIGGYPKMSHFGTVVGERFPEGRDEYLRYYNGSVDLAGSPALTRIEKLSRDTDVFLVIGVIERDGGTLYCSVVFVDPLAGLVGKHRKLMPTASERLIWGQGDGSTLPVLNASFKGSNGVPTIQAKLSAAICWENYMPLLRTHYYTLGTELYCAPTVDSRPVWQASMTHIAIEGRCFVLSACQYAQERDFPQDHAVRDESDRNPDNVMIGGGSVIISPLGTILAGPLLKGEGVIVADLDLDEIIRGKYDLDVVGHYARPSIFQLTSNLSSGLA